MPIFLRSLDVSFVVINKLPERVRKSIQGLVCPKLTAQVSVLELFLTHQMTILLIGCKPNNFESHKSLELSFTNIQGLHLNFTEYESPPPPPWHSCLGETVLDDWSDSGNFSVRVHLPLIQQDSVTHFHKLAVYMKEGFPFTQNLFRAIPCHGSPELVNWNFLILKQFFDKIFRKNVKFLLSKNFFDYFH